jgi:hypothetical protein
MLNGPEPKFQLKQEVSSYDVPGSAGKHTGYVQKICMHEDGTITYMTTFHPGWLDESRLHEVPDTVMIEILRSTAEAFTSAPVAFWDTKGADVCRASFKALGK